MNLKIKKMGTRRIFVMFAVVGMLLATSCSNDEALNLSEKETLVTLSLGLENSMNTRAISDGTGVNKLIYAIFDSKGNRVVESGGSAEFTPEKTFALLKGEEYTAVFWVQNKDCNAYSISEDYKTITVNYTGASNNDESRDAFFKAETFTATEGTNIHVVLKRPFAQVNLGITVAEWENAKNLGFEVTSSSVEISQAATTLNLMDGSVGGAENITFASNQIPANETLKVDINCDGETEEYKYLSMSPCKRRATKALAVSQTVGRAKERSTKRARISHRHSQKPNEASAKSNFLYLANTCIVKIVRRRC